MERFEGGVQIESSALQSVVKHREPGRSLVQTSQDKYLTGRCASLNSTFLFLEWKGKGQPDSKKEKTPTVLGPFSFVSIYQTICFGALKRARQEATFSRLFSFVP